MRIMSAATRTSRPINRVFPNTVRYLSSVPADEIQLRLISPLRPGLIHAEGDDFWYLIMPIRIAG